MFTKKPILKILSVVLIVIFLLVGFLPVHAEAPASRLSVNGDFMWAKRMGGSNSDSGYSIATDSSGNVYITGSFRGTVDFDPGAGISNLTSASTGYSDIFVSKLDGNGNFLWAKRMGGAGTDYGMDIAIDSTGNVHIIGAFEGTGDFDPGLSTAHYLTSAGEEDIFVSKLDGNGNFLWAMRMGGAGADYGEGIAVDVNGDVHTTGSFKNTADFNPSNSTYNMTSAGQSDIFVSRLDSSGNFVRARRMGGTSVDHGYGIAIDTSGNIYTTGYFGGTADFDTGAGTYPLTSAGDYDIFVSKLSNASNFVWAKRMGGTGNDEAYGIAVDSSSHVYTTGRFKGTADFDPSVGVINLSSAGYNDIFVSRLNSSGNFVWAKSMGGSDFDEGKDIALDLGGNVYTTGHFENTADFDPAAATTYYLPGSGYDIFVSKLDNAGNFVWAKHMGGTISDHGEAIALGSGGSIHTTGRFQGTADFDPGPGTTFHQTSAGSSDIFVSKLEANEILTSTFRSTGANDGWILESTETSNAGGSLNTTATTFNLGDNAQDKQYRSILHFDTSSLPDNAVITKVTLKIRKQGLVGTNPFTLLGGLKVDMRKPSFGTAALAVGDFQAAAGKSNVATFNATPVSNWYSALLNATGRNYVNKTGTTQFRLCFATDDNNDNGTDTMKFFSGDYATASARPTLIIEYYIP